eukprot:5617741-Alexandrium_andersonii.AAC.1
MSVRGGLSASNVDDVARAARWIECEATPTPPIQSARLVWLDIELEVCEVNLGPVLVDVAELWAIVGHDRCVGGLHAPQVKELVAHLGLHLAERRHA